MFFPSILDILMIGCMHVFCSYTDPVDGSKASNQGIRIMFTGEKLGRFVFFKFFLCR
jgi:hypothetical protein